MTVCEASQYLQEIQGEKERERGERWMGGLLKVNHEIISDNEEK